MTFEDDPDDLITDHRMDRNAIFYAVGFVTGILFTVLVLWMFGK